MAHQPKIDQHFAPSIATLGGISPQAILAVRLSQRAIQTL